jgi:hypothetical protein
VQAAKIHAGTKNQKEEEKTEGEGERQKDSPTKIATYLRYWNRATDLNVKATLQDDDPQAKQCESWGATNSTP